MLKYTLYGPEVLLTGLQHSVTGCLISLLALVSCHLLRLLELTVSEKGKTTFDYNFLKIPIWSINILELIIFLFQLERQSHF